MHRSALSLFGTMPYRRVGGFTRRESGAFTLIELLVVIAIIAILAAILFPVFARAREKARQSSCQNNLKQMAVALQQYSQDYDEVMAWDYYAQSSGISPAGAGAQGTFLIHRWPGKIQPYVKNQNIFQCPSASVRVSGTSATAPDTDLITYWGAGGMFALPGSNAVALAQVAKPAETVYVYDDLDAGMRDAVVFRPWWTGNNYNGNVTGTNSSFNPNRKPIHTDGVNVMYADSHVKFRKLGQLYKEICPEYVYPFSGVCTAPTQVK